jgi:hypothetical protein
LFAAAAHAEDDDISTDRPDFVESGSVVGKNVFQIETSLAWEEERRDGLKIRTQTIPTLLRYGIADTLELRVETDGPTRQKINSATDNTTESGFADTSLGIKWQLQEASGTSHRPAMALLAHVDLNSGSAAFRGSGEVPSLRIVAEWELSDDASFGIMPGMAWAKDDTGERYLSGILAATYSRPLAGELRGFVELAGKDLRSERHGGNQATFDAGLSYKLDRDTQLDTAINLGLNQRVGRESWKIPRFCFKPLIYRRESENRPPTPQPSAGNPEHSHQNDLCVPSDMAPTQPVFPD